MKLIIPLLAAIIPMALTSTAHATVETSIKPIEALSDEPMQEVVVDGTRSFNDASYANSVTMSSSSAGAGGGGAAGGAAALTSRTTVSQSIAKLTNLLAKLKAAKQTPAVVNLIKQINAILNPRSVSAFTDSILDSLEAEANTAIAISRSFSVPIVISGFSTMLNSLNCQMGSARACDALTGRGSGREY